MRCKKQDKSRNKRKERPKNNKIITFRRILAKKQSKNESIEAVKQKEIN
jgi:hypothetical protein